MVCKWQVEIDDYANKVLTKHWPDVPKFRDVRTFPPRCQSPWLGGSWRDTYAVDVICGGFPCQDISYAGQGAGLDGERSGLFFEAIRVVRELRPRIVVLENVAALLTRGLDRVLGTLAEIGYDAEWHCIPAAAVGAPHIRDRVFVIGMAADSSELRRNTRWTEQSLQGIGAHGAACLADAELTRLERAARSRVGRTVFASTGSEDVADANESVSSEGRLQRGGQFMRAGCDQTTDSRSGLDGNWITEPDVGRVAHGVPKRVHRLRGLGNAVVPQVAEWIGRRIIESLPIDTDPAI